MLCSSWNEACKTGDLPYSDTSPNGERSLGGSITVWGRGSGQVVSLLSFYSNDPSLYPAEVNSLIL